MKTLRLALAAALALCLSATKVHAVLKDHGPADPVVTFPSWYRDLNGLALGLCKSTAISPNPGGAPGEMCFPNVPNPAGFAGNLGDEMFHFHAGMTINDPKDPISFSYLAAIEAAYLADAPTRGAEWLFARLRFILRSPILGQYTVTHPYGQHVLNMQEGDGGKLVVTVDVPGGANDFESALGGPVGPFLQWDTLAEGETLTVGDEKFVGDPNILHKFIGSPFGTNFLELRGPQGADLDGAGGNVLFTDLASILGKVWTEPIPSVLSIRRATYRRDASGATTLNVWATSSEPNAQLLLSSNGLPSVPMTSNGGAYFASVTLPQLPTTFVSVHDLTSTPVSVVTAALADELTCLATFTVGGNITVTASSSDATAPSDDRHALTVTTLGTDARMERSNGGLFTYSAPLAGDSAPPFTITISSAGGGSAVCDVAVVNAAAFAASASEAVGDVFSNVPGAGITSLDVLANDSPGPLTRIVVLSQPAQGTAVEAADGTGVTFTPKPGASGADAFDYVLTDAAGSAFSNVASVALQIVFAPGPPNAKPESFALRMSAAASSPSTRVVPVLANDVPATSAAINASSVVVSTPPTAGAAVANADGTVLFTAPTTAGTVTFQYTVSSSPGGAVSTPATVTAVVFASAEAVTITRAEYRVGKNRWTVVGTSSWFAAALPDLTATCWVGGVGTAPSSTNTIGSAPVDATGTFQVAPPAGTQGARINTVNTAVAVTCQTSSGGVGRTQVLTRT